MSVTVQFHFSDSPMTNNVNVIRSGVWTDQAQQNWCYSLIMHVLTTTTKTSKQTPCSCRDRNESVVSFGYTWPVKRSKAHRPSLRPPYRSRNPYKSPPDRIRNPYKSPPTILFPLPLWCRHSCWLHLGISLSSSLRRLQPEFASRSYSTPHKTAAMPPCVVFSTTRDGRVCLIVIVRYNSVFSLHQSHLH